MHDTMIQAVRSVRANAYNPYSKFQVGACILASDGKLYTGCNVENSSYGLTICAEGSAICTMISQAGANAQIEEILICPCMPCGACRQRIAEFSHSDTLVHVMSAEDETGSAITTYSMDSLLPHRFTDTDIVPAAC